MYWYDWMGLAVFVAVTIIQTARGVKAGGMGLPAFEAAGLVVAAVASVKFAPTIASSTHLQPSTVLIVLFISLGFLAFVVGRWLFTLTGWSFESLDSFFSFIFGLAAAYTIAHMVMRIIITSQGPDGEIMTNIANAPVVRELYQFRTWNVIVEFLFRVKLGPDIEENVG